MSAKKPAPGPSEDTLALAGDSLEAGMEQAAELVDQLEQLVKGLIEYSALTRPILPAGDSDVELLGALGSEVDGEVRRDLARRRAILGLLERLEPLGARLDDTILALGHRLRRDLIRGPGEDGPIRSLGAPARERRRRP